MKEEEIIDVAAKALAWVTDLKSNEDVIVVTDEAKREVGDAFCEGAKELGSQAKIYKLPKERPLTEVPEKFHLDANVFVNVFEMMSGEMSFRVKLLHKEVRKNSRVIHATGITKQMMRKNGPVDTDYGMVFAKAQKLISALESVDLIVITTSAGTNLLLNTMDRVFDTDVKIGPGCYGNIPSGEVYGAPIEESGRGILVCDGSIGDFGLASRNVFITVTRGKIASLEAKEGKYQQKLLRALSQDRMANVIGKLGIGLNPNAKITGNLLEDEKANGTLHIAFGRNLDIKGGRNDSGAYRDFLIRNPTLRVKYANGKEKILIKRGTIL
jgi:leucyl aminopeptidase (aminopeptidase T)